MTPRLQLWWMDSDSLVRLTIHWDQSPRDWHLRPSTFDTNPRGPFWSNHDVDVTTSILCDVPLRKITLCVNTWLIGEWLAIVHLRVVVDEAFILRFLHCQWLKTDVLEGKSSRAPKNVRCSIFNEILPIRDWWTFNLNDGHWLIRTQAWAISVKGWDVAYQWIFAWYVRKHMYIDADKCWVALRFRNGSFDGDGTMWRHNRINPNTTKGRLLRIKGFFRWHFTTVGVEQIVYFPQQCRCYENKLGECWMDIRYRGFESGSTAWALASPPLPPDSKALRSESDIFTMRARGSCGVDPVTMPVSPMGDWLHAVRNRLVPAQSLMFSTFAMQRFTTWAVWGGAIDLALMHPRKGLPRTGVFRGITPSLA